MPLSGNVNFGDTTLSPEENGWGGFVVPTTDASGIQLSIGDTVRAPNPTPGANGLPNTPQIIGVIVAFGGSLCTINVPSSTSLSTAVAVYNVNCSRCLQLYSNIQANMERESGL